MFQLDQHDAVFSHLNLRKEKHGDEDAAAADLKFTLTAPATPACTTTACSWRSITWPSRRNTCRRNTALRWPHEGPQL